MTETPHIDHGVRHQIHPVVALPDVLETEEGGVSDLYFHSNVCHADLRFLKGGSMALIPVQ
jgi:hypothetical protein